MSNPYCPTCGSVVGLKRSDELGARLNKREADAADEISRLRGELAMALAERDAAVSMGTQLERERDRGVLITSDQAETLRASLEAYLASVAGCNYGDGPIAEELRDIRDTHPAFARPRRNR